MAYVKPVNIVEYDIHDIFINDCNKLVIVRNFQQHSYPIYFFNPLKNDYEMLLMITCPHLHTIVHQSKDEVFCLLHENKKVKFKILLFPVEDERTFEAFPNRYPTFTNEILMSTLVKNEEPVITQWIDYYKNLGINKFIIYDNSSDTTLGDVLQEYINRGDVLLIRWNYRYYFEKSGFSAQTTQQNHSIYLAQNAKYIGMFDVDEYVNLKEHMKIDDFLKKQINEFSINENSIGGYCFFSKNFHNPRNLPTDGTNFFEIFDCEEVGKIEKNFVIPKNTVMYSVHIPVLGKKTFQVLPSEAYYNHYIFLNKKDRGLNETILKDTTIQKHLTYLL
jgi:hypothetical protein